ncbi:MAG: sigma-70 family RNA polymerase sigma factor [Parcubacteria group bacterium]|nr:sigma-70 family RNA polymerase sigma factor [Parcubacteria group bacterium]
MENVSKKAKRSKIVDKQKQKKVSKKPSNSINDVSTRYISQLCRHPLLSKKRERELITVFQSHECESTSLAARDELIRCNMRLVFKIAKKYYKTQNFLSFTDLMHIGSMFGIVRAAEKFNPSKFDVRFSTYASVWIKQAIVRKISEQKRMIRVPCGFGTKCQSARKDLLKELRREPSLEELADYLKTSVSVVRAVFRVPFSYNKENKKTDDTMASRIPQEGASLPGLVIAREDVDMLWDFLEQPCRDPKTDLTDLEKMILSDRFGLANGDSVSLKEISEYGGVTRERIRQYETIALNKLRAKFGLDPSRFRGRRRKKAC